MLVGPLLCGTGWGTRGDRKGELTLPLASSRPLLLLSFSTKRGSTGDALETEAENGVSLGGGLPVCGHLAPGPESKPAGQVAPKGQA